MDNVSLNGDGIPASAEAQRSLVRRGYDAISVAYRDDDGLSGHDDLDHRDQYLGWIDELASSLPRAARVLDLGCGCGVPATRALADQRRLFTRMAVWLRPGGWALLIVGSGRWRAVEDFLGAPMFWDHADRDTYLRWLGDDGLEVIWNRFIPEGEGSHVLVLARKPEA